MRALYVVSRFFSQLDSRLTYRIIPTSFAIAFFAAVAFAQNSGPVLSVSSNTVNFGSIAVGQTVSQSVTLSSTGNAPVTISGISVAGSLFSATGITTPMTLNPGQTATLNLGFTSPHVSTFTGVVTITSNSSAGKLTINMSAAGVAANPVLAVNSSTINFGNIVVGQTVSQSVTLSSTGNAPVTISGISVAGSLFSATGITTPMTLNTGQTATLNLGFTSPHVSTFTGVVTITSNSSAGNLTINMSAAGIAGNPVLSVSSSTINFGNILVGQTVSQSVTLSSTGNAPVTVSGISVAGSLFSATGITMPMTLNPGQTATLNLGFTSPHVSTFTGVVTITGNSSAGNLTINMSAAGVSPALSAISCTQASMTGAGTDACTVTLNGIAPSGGVAVALSSSDTAVVVPASVTVPANATSTVFAAAVSAVMSSQTATLTGTGGAASQTFTLQLNAATPTLAASSTTVNFGNINVGQNASQAITLSSTGNAPVTISSISVAGSLFSATGVTTPMTLNPGQTAALNLGFTSSHVSSFTGIVTIASNSSAGNLTINMSAAGIAALSSISCANSTLTGASSDACTATLNGTAWPQALTINLASNNPAAVVPSSVTVAAGASSATFNVAASSVSSTQTAVISGSANGVSASFSLQLTSSGSAQLSVNPASLAFGNVVENDTATQPITLTSSGTGPVTINSITASGASFSTSTMTLPATLNSGQTATLNVQFAPTATGVSSGQLAIATNSTATPTVTMSLSGTGLPHEVALNWQAPSSTTDAVAGYNVYRAISGNSSYQKLNASLQTQTTYTDSTPQGSVSYLYYVTSVDGSGLESVPSNTASVTIP
jgi:hypothetical protein